MLFFFSSCSCILSTQTFHNVWKQRPRFTRSVSLQFTQAIGKLDAAGPWMLASSAAPSQSGKDLLHINWQTLMTNGVGEADGIGIRASTWPLKASRHEDRSNIVMQNAGIWD